MTRFRRSTLANIEPNSGGEKLGKINNGLINYFVWINQARIKSKNLRSAPK